MRNHPPRWAEAGLRTFLSPEAFASISGDLLEQYRDSILPRRGLSRADAWYIRQVFGFVLRGTGVWAALFAAALVARNWLDALRPTTDFHLRSEVSTALAFTLLLALGFRSAWRSGAFISGALAGLAATGAAAVLSLLGTAALLAIWHDPGTLTAIRDSGGLGEALLPFWLMLPGAVLGCAGGLGGAAARRLFRT